MTNIFKVLLATCLLGGLVFIFAFLGKEEVKSEQRVQEATQAVQESEFDSQFEDAWNGEPGAKVRKARNEHVADLKAKADRARAKRDGLDQFFDEAVNSAKEAVHDEDARLAGRPASAVASAGGSR